MKRYIAFIFLFALCFAAFPQTVRAEVADDLTLHISLTCENIDGSAVSLTDGDISTRMTLNGNSVIEIKCDTPISSLYLIWDKPPNVWNLTTEDVRVTYGKYGFIHEYISLDKPQTGLTLTFHGNENILCNLYAFADGEAPDWAEQWQPPYEDADMLLFPAHTDDDTFYLGEVIPLYATGRDMKLQLAYMTNQWMQPKYMHELISRLYTAGIRAYPVISDFQDTLAPSLDDIIGIYDEDAFIAFCVEQIRRFKPPVIIGAGGNGDGIRQLSHESLLIAAELSGDSLEYRDSALEYGAFDSPKLYMHDHPSDQAMLGLSDFELIRTTVGPDAAIGDFFENIDFSTVPELTAPPEASAAEASPPTADVPPAAPIRPGPAKSIIGRLASLPIIFGISVACLVAATLLHIKKEA